MGAHRLVNQTLLRSESTKAWIHTRIVELISSESAVPTLSGAAHRLTALLSKEDVGLAMIGDVISLDPGLCTRCLRAANSAARGRRNIQSINDALLIIGLNEVRRFAMTMGVLNNFSHLRISVDWDRFWLHSVLVGRLTEKLAGGFRDTSGLDYLAGLLHDVGKLIEQHYFPREFEQVIIRSLERKCGHAPMEKEILGLDHAQIGAAICDVLLLPANLTSGIRYHHEALTPQSIADQHGEQAFLASCICVADTLANIAGATMGGEKPAPPSLDEIPEWIHLNNTFSCRGLNLDLEEELSRAKSEISAYK
jgi:putative nucleotidyltransferase with HDIG domain